MMANKLQRCLSIFASTYRVVVWLIPSLLRLGLIDETECLLLGGLIGTVVACCSIRSPMRQDPPVGQDLGPTCGSRGVFPI